MHLDKTFKLGKALRSVSPILLSWRWKRGPEMLTCLRTQWQCWTGIQTAGALLLLPGGRSPLTWIQNIHKVYHLQVYNTKSEWKPAKLNCVYYVGLLCEIKTIFQEKHSLMCFNFFFCINFLGNEKSKKVFMHFTNILLPKLTFFF